MKKFKIAIVGATGAVGLEIVKCLHKRNFPVEEIILFASKRSSGKSITTDYGEMFIKEFNVEDCRQCHFVFLAVSSEFSLEYAPKITDDRVRGKRETCVPYVIDNSSAFRYVEDVPLVVRILFLVLLLYFSVADS
jgi:aspartate-semialdehyde dehydrogenase